MVIQSPAVFEAIIGASAIGVLTLNTGKADAVYPGAVGWVSKDDASAAALVKVLMASGNTVVVRRFKGDVERAVPQYGRSDMSAFATGSHLCLDAQLSQVNPAHSKRDAA
jgi:hypothetical protein